MWRLPLSAEPRTLGGARAGCQPMTRDWLALAEHAHCVRRIVRTHLDQRHAGRVRRDRNAGRARHRSEHRASERESRSITRPTSVKACGPPPPSVASNSALRPPHLHTVSVVHKGPGWVTPSSQRPSPQTGAFHGGCRINARECAALLSGGRRDADSGRNRNPVPLRCRLGPL